MRVNCGECRYVDSYTADILRAEIAGLRNHPHVAGQFEKMIAEDLADSLQARLDAAEIWCVLCGAVDGEPHAGPTKAGPCGGCGAPLVPDVELKGILGDPYEGVGNAWIDDPMMGE